MDYNSRCLLPLLCLLPGLLSAGDVRVFPREGTDYSKYKSYEWAPVKLVTPEGLSENDSRISPLMVASVDKELQKKGLKLVPSGGDVRVQIAVLYTPTSQLSGYLVTYGFDTFDGWAPVGAMAVSNVVKQGTVAIALVDPKVNKGIWSGVAVEGLGPLGKIGGSVDNAVSKIFKKYPALK